MVYEVIIHSSEGMIFTLATVAVQKSMNWDFFRAHQFCQKAGEDGSAVLCVAQEKKAHQYVKELKELSLLATCRLI